MTDKSFLHSLLVTNDDGCKAKGLDWLAARLKAQAKVIVVAPDRDRSGASHALTTSHPLSVESQDFGDQLSVNAISGTPADCVYIGVCHFMKISQPSVVISGVNRGFNIADDIPYSGTIAAAREASLLDIPAIAVSAEDFSDSVLEVSCQLAEEVVSLVLGSPKLLPAGVFLNVNVPAFSDARFRITTIGRRRYSRDVLRIVDPRAKEHLWIGGDALQHDDIPGSDCNAILDERVISITPMRFNSVAEDLIYLWRKVKLPSFVASR